MIKSEHNTVNAKIKSTNIEREYILSYIEKEFSDLLDELNNVIMVLNNSSLLESTNNVQHIKDLKQRIEGIKKLIKDLTDLNTNEHSHNNCVDLCDLGSILEKMLPLLKIYGQDKGVIINSFIYPSIRIKGNSSQLKSVFKQLLYLLIKEFETGGTVELSAQKENHGVMITINVHGSMKFEITNDAILSLEELFSKKLTWKTQATKLFFISNTLKQNQSKMTIRKISSFHRTISILLPTNGSVINQFFTS